MTGATGECHRWMSTNAWRNASTSTAPVCERWPNLRAVTPVFFASSAEMRAWLEAHHATAPELWVGLYKKGSGKTGITIQEAQDQGMCFGWVDSLSGRIDDDSYMLRFTPRRPRSNWAERSIERAEELRAHGQMHEAGIRAFERRR